MRKVRKPQITANMLTTTTTTTTTELEQLPLDVPIEEEHAPHYKAQHFYHATPGEVLDKRFKLLAKVGYGATSTVWLAQTTSWIKKRYVAIKIKSSDIQSQKDAEHETEISKIIKRSGNSKDRTHVCTVDENFHIQGPGGMHTCLVMEPLRDPLWLVRRRICGSKATHEFLPLFKMHIRALLLGLDYLHSKCSVIHTDLKIDNLMLDFEDDVIIKDFVTAQATQPMARKTYTDHTIYRSHNDFGRLRGMNGVPALLLMAPKITDFGHAQKAKAGSGEPLVHPIQPDHCRAPEVLLGLTWSYSADIWNFGVMIYDLLDGKPLFSHITDNSGIYSAKHHLVEMTQLLGPIPSDMLHNVLKKGDAWRWAPPVQNDHGTMSSTANEYFGGPFYDSYGELIHTHLNPSIPHTKSWKSSIPECIEDEEADFTDFMKKMLCWSPEKRSTAKELFDHPWLKY